MEFRIATSEVSFHLTLNGRFNVIIGKSGTGKSFLTSTVARIQQDEEMSLQQPIMPVSMDWEDWIEVESPRLIVIDEGGSAPQAKIRRNMQAMMRSNHYYIFCMRDDVDYIPHGLRTTFIMTGGPKRFRMEPAYDVRLLTRRVSGTTDVVCEDKGLGFDLLSKILSGSDVRVCSSEGRSALLQKLASLPDVTKACLVFDSCGAGRQLGFILESVRAHRCAAFDARSLEYEIGSSLFGEAVMEYEDSDHRKSDSEEEYYFQRLRDLMRRKLGISYTKTTPALSSLLASGKGMLQDGFHDLRADGYDVNKIYEEFRELSKED